MLDFHHQYQTRKSRPTGDFTGRRKFVIIFMMTCMTVLVGRAFYLQVFSKDFLKEQGEMRYVDEVSISAYRGMITDRNGEPLAISSPVQTIWINAKDLKGVTEAEFKSAAKALAKEQHAPLTDQQKETLTQTLQAEKRQKVAQMEKILQLPAGKISSQLTDNTTRQFAYVARRISPDLAEQVKTLKLVGVNIEREFKRYYPAGEVSAHLVGFTDVDDVGQEGVEKGYEKYLKGTPGSKRVIRDGQRQIIADVENIKEPVSGKTLELSIDQRIQYLAHKELQQAMEENKAKSASLVVLDAQNGEILAAVSQPSFNPNIRGELKESLYRNRAMTDIFEPGSTVKPFTVAAALEGKFIRPDSIFPTNGTLQVGNHVVRDVHNYGTLNLTGVIKKSSNVGVSLMALKMPAKYFWGVYTDLGFGTSAGAGFPGEASGRLLDHRRWHDFDKATMSFGYGVSVSAVQLARAYTALADDGVLHSVSLLKRDEDLDAKRVFSSKTAKSVRAMMEHVVLKDGTAYEARIEGYTVAGKTGTVKKATAHGYTDKTYFAVFAGLAPAKNPRLIVVVMIDEPSAGKYYGGLVSAPVFSKVMAGALRVLGVAPDQEDTMPILLSKQEQ